MMGKLKTRVEKEEYAKDAIEEAEDDGPGILDLDEEKEINEAWDLNLGKVIPNQINTI